MAEVVEIENCRFRQDEVAALQFAHDQLTIFLKGGAKFTVGMSAKDYKAHMEELLPLKGGDDGREIDPEVGSG